MDATIGMRLDPPISRTRSMPLQVSAAASRTSSMTSSVRFRSGAVARFVDQPQDVEPGDLRGVLGGDAGGVVEVGGDGDDDVADLLAEGLPGRRGEVPEDERRDVLGQVLPVAVVDEGGFPASHLPFDEGDVVVGPQGGHVLGDRPDDRLPVVEEDHRGRQAPRLAFQVVPGDPAVGRVGGVRPQAFEDGDRLAETPGVEQDGGDAHVGRLGRAGEGPDMPVGRHRGLPVVELLLDDRDVQVAFGIDRVVAGGLPCLVEGVAELAEAGVGARQDPPHLGRLPEGVARLAGGVGGGVVVVDADVLPGLAQPVVPSAHGASRIGVRRIGPAGGELAVV